MGWIGSVRCEKFRCDFKARTCASIEPIQPILHRVSCTNEILPNTPKQYETHTNMSLGSNVVDWVCSLRKMLMRLHGTNFCINCTSSPCFASKFIQLGNYHNRTQILRNTPKLFRVQWGALDAFVVKNPEVTSWHELLH